MYQDLFTRQSTLLVQLVSVEGATNHFRLNYEAADVHWNADKKSYEIREFFINSYIICTLLIHTHDRHLFYIGNRIGG